jgi:N-acetylmuramoyl-L-alanine amidase
MTISQDGWFDWAERVPFPGWKTNGGRNGLQGLAAHSAEGWESYLRGYANDQSRRASWNLSNLRSGVLLQHYPVFAQTWTSGAGWPNNNLVGMESEGIAGQPLNEAQIANVERVLRDLSVFTGRTDIQRIGQRTSAPDGVLLIVEHREATRWGAAATECPSDRYPWGEILGRLVGEIEPPPPAPEPEEEEEEMEWKIVGEPGPEQPRSYLLVKGHLHWIDNGTIYEDLEAMTYGAGPVELRQETWDWLHREGIATV